MPKNEQDARRWVETIRDRYESYLKASFYFKDDRLRRSFEDALGDLEGDDSALTKGPFPEPPRSFAPGARAEDVAAEFFPGESSDLTPALLLDGPLHRHQEDAIRLIYGDGKNTVVTTGTASGKTECFLYPILFELYRQHLDGKLQEPGVRALILYPMNALANDQMDRLREIGESLKVGGSDFAPTFGQYIGETKEEERAKMRENPPHILLTNYSMLEYLLIRPKDSELFDGERGRHWQFLILDEAHQYRGVKGMEIGMLLRRLKRRLRDGGRNDPFRCIATSATLARDESDDDRKAVADFARNLFGERFENNSVIFGETEHRTENDTPARFHFFMRALEGAFLTHENGESKVVLNRAVKEGENGELSVPLEIALCKECGQHYYVGRESGGHLKEAVRDPSDRGFGVKFYLPIESDGEEENTHFLCLCCGRLSGRSGDCSCRAEIPVKKCESHPKHKDRLKECAVCGYQRGGIGDPVQEIVHGTDAPNAVIATAMHCLFQPDESRKVLAFADSRQEAAFFAGYAEDSYRDILDRNLIFRVLRDKESVGIDRLKRDMVRYFETENMPAERPWSENTTRALAKIFREMFTDERRISLEGTGLAKWLVEIPPEFEYPEEIFASPWSLSSTQAADLLRVLLDDLRAKRVVDISTSAYPDAPLWTELKLWPQQSVRGDSPRGGQNTVSWVGRDRRRATVDFLVRLLSDSDCPESGRIEKTQELLSAIWDRIQAHDRNSREEKKFFVDCGDGKFRLDLRRWRVKRLIRGDAVYRCNLCARLSSFNIREVCARRGCKGKLRPIDTAEESLVRNHYRVLYADPKMPVEMRAEEHTAQIKSEVAREYQDDFKQGNIHLLSSSTTFEVGVDLGDLDVGFLRNVPPESFNYTQRAGRVGRRGTPGLVVTYCRRRPHDLHHYADPEAHILRGQSRPPQLRLHNEKIIMRHVAAVALSSFFRAREDRFDSVEKLVTDWNNPRACECLRRHCESSDLEALLRDIVPSDMHGKIGLQHGEWIDKIAGPESRFDEVEKEVCNDYRNMLRLEDEASGNREHGKAARAKSRAQTIESENVLTFLSRKAVIPKYGFPVDVVELDVRMASDSRLAKTVKLQRDLSQAIAEFAPGGKVVANKKEWSAYGVKKIDGKEWPRMYYAHCAEHNFFSRAAIPNGVESCCGKERKGKYIEPRFGFVTEWDAKVEEPKRRGERLYTTRPHFVGFDEEPNGILQMSGRVRVTPASPGAMVVLCEGRRGNNGFYICPQCGASFPDRQSEHKNPYGNSCNGRPVSFCLGHEFVTDVTRLQFNADGSDNWSAHSLAYALLYGAADVLEVPDMDLGATITRATGAFPGVVFPAIALYDNVPGGAGLVASLKDERMLREVLEAARTRVSGRCKCDESCYGCLRSYRNQFAHPHLQRKAALGILEETLAEN